MLKVLHTKTENFDWDKCFSEHSFCAYNSALYYLINLICETTTFMLVLIFILPSIFRFESFALSVSFVKFFIGFPPLLKNPKLASKICQ